MTPPGDDRSTTPAGGNERLATIEGDIRRILTGLGRDYGAAPSPDNPAAAAATTAANRPAKPGERAQLARSILRHRRQRADHFPVDLFSDPAWDMLLDLYAADDEGADVPVSSLCVAAAVPQTTALRWINVLVNKGLAVRQETPGATRRVHIALSDKGRASLDDYFAAIMPLPPDGGELV